VTTTASEVRAKGAAAKLAARTLPRLSSDDRNRALLAVADSILAHESDILAANARDLEAGREAGLDAPSLDRLVLDRAKLEEIAGDVRSVASLPDPIGEMFDTRTLANGLQIGRKRVPLGVIAAVFESRPNVTVDIASLCLKSGNACILRGGKEAINSNIALAAAVREALAAAGAPADAVQLIENTDRALLADLLKMADVIDLLVPRGGMPLIDYVRENAAMPVLVGGRGVCHIYVDRTADLDKAVAIAFNAKTRKVSNCNALDTLLVHEEVAQAFLPAMARAFAGGGVEMRCDEPSLAIVQGVNGANALPAGPDDYGFEFLALVASVKVVASLDEALDHIYRYGSGHSDAIITEDYSNAMRFVDEVDTAVVYVNASTQFTDGAQFGLGAEIIDSTQKTIARGPVGLREITTYKWIVLGRGQTRP
jgi:glutamate-5-semialdehyde dehydrogenase